MKVPVSIQLGLNGAVRSIGRIVLDPKSVEAAAAWCGSYSILYMGQHYDHYVITDKIAKMPKIPGFPTPHPYTFLTGKIRAGAVTGNIGEIVAGLFAARFLYAPIRSIAHINPNQRYRKRKSPDYMMEIGGLLPGVFQPIMPSQPTINFPTWLPVESKARSTAGSATAARRAALSQLKTYWSLLCGNQPSVVGFGIVVTFKFQEPKEVRATLFLPLHQSKLVNELKKRGERISLNFLRAQLHEC